MEQLKTHIEGKFESGMTWDNWSHGGWHIDHIYPMSRADLTDEIQLKKVCNYKNLSPLWAHDNFSKHATIPDGLTL